MKHVGGCHCGTVKYEVNADLTGDVISCNCSICSKKGHLLTFVSEDQFQLLSGEDSLSDYQFNQKKIHHLFCKSCGIGSYGMGLGRDGEKMCAVNVRCLEGVDVSTLRIVHIDGRSF